MDPRALLDSLDLGVAMLAADGTVVEWSAAAERLTRRNARDAIGKRAAPALVATLDQVRLDGRPRTCRMRAGTVGRPDLRVDAEISAAPDGRFFVVLQEAHPDRLAWHAAELLSAFDAERRVYQHAFHALPVPALLTTTAGQILEANAAAATFLSQPDPELLESRALVSFVPESQHPMLRAALRHAILEPQQLELTLNAGGAGEAQTVRTQVLNVSGSLDAPELLFWITDPAPRPELRRKLLLAERLAQLGGLISGVAHDLNNPLSATAAFAEVLLADAPRESLRESAEIIRSEAVRAGRILRALIEFAQSRAPARGPVDLRAVVERVLSLEHPALERASVQVSVRAPLDLPAVCGDAQELDQVVLKAVMNARQAIETTGTAGELCITLQRVDDCVRAVVEDSGPGVPPDQLERVFEPFFTTKGEYGIGLGLSMAFALVRGMNGRMWMQNHPGGGACLSFELPVDHRLPAPLPSREAAPTRRRLTILVVENEENVRRGTVLLATRLGHHVTAVAGFAEALRSLRQNAGDARYDALLVDIHLEDGHTGFELFEALRAQGMGRERSVIFTSGDSISPNTNHQLTAAGRPLLRKPFGLADLSRILERVTVD